MVGLGECQFIGSNSVLHNEVLVVLSGKQVVRTSAETTEDQPYCRKIDTHTDTQRYRMLFKAVARVSISHQIKQHRDKFHEQRISTLFDS